MVGLDLLIAMRMPRSQSKAKATEPVASSFGKKTRREWQRRGNWDRSFAPEDQLAGFVGAPAPLEHPDRRRQVAVTPPNAHPPTLIN